MHTEKKNIGCIPDFFFHGIPGYYIQTSSVDRRLLKGEQLRSKRILNVGCGSYLLDDIYFAMNGAKVIGIDYSNKAVDQANKKLETAKEKRLFDYLDIKIEWGDGRNLRFSDDFFDIVVSYSAIEHIPSPKDRLRTVTEMARVAKRGGAVVITVPNYLNLPTTFLSRRMYKKIKEFEYRYTPAELKRMLTYNHLKIEKFDAESVYVMDKHLIETRLPELKNIPSFFLRPMSWLLWGFNYFPLLKKFGMRMGYRARKI